MGFQFRELLLEIVTNQTDAVHFQSLVERDGFFAVAWVIDIGSKVVVSINWFYMKVLSQLSIFQ